MDNIDVSVLKYLGKVDKGIIVLINIILKNSELNFDATFYYTDTNMILTIPEDVENKIGDIKKLPEYPQILRLCLRKVIPYDQMIDNIDPLDVEPILKALFPNGEFE